MDSTSSTSSEQSSQSSGNEITPNSDSGTSRTIKSRAHTKSSRSPTLQAVNSFVEALGQFLGHVLTEYRQNGSTGKDAMKGILTKMDIQYEIMKKELAYLILHLDEAIEQYEEKKKTALPIDANSVISPNKPERYRVSSFKYRNQSLGKTFDVLDAGIAKLRVAIKRKIDASIYEDYSFSMENKLKNLKELCKNQSKDLDHIGEMIKEAIEKNNKSNDD